MRAELADGTELHFPDEMPDHAMDMEVMKHMAMKQHTTAMERHTEAMNNLARQMADLAAAFRAPRKITVERNIKDEVTGATSTIKR
jgi:hypothetical protein